MSFDQAGIDAQLKAARPIASAILQTLATERGAHAETVIAAAARMGGTFLFRTFGLPAGNIAPGSPVLSDVANERGPVLVEVMQSGLAGLGVEIPATAGAVDPGPDHAPHIGLIETQQRLDGKLTAIASAHGLSAEGAARACALATAMLISDAREMLAPPLGFAIAVYGFVEGTKTMPIAAETAGGQPAGTKKPWYRF